MKLSNKTVSVSCADLSEPYRKYLSTNPKVENYLEVWARGKALVRAEHFFWIMGGTVQKSREGLLRHLLYSALLSLPAEDMALAQRVFGMRRLSNLVQRAWSYKELHDMLARLVSYTEAKFFFLVDALDECDPQDLHAELADEITKISQLPNVKLCISCRPWKPFVSKFRRDRTLHLEIMTYRDMEYYIRNRLANADEENDICSEFRSPGRTGRATCFVTDIVHAAEGVFLWTELVVKALCSELRKGCGFAQLERARSEFPIGLDEYFQKLVFDRITKTRQNSSDTAAALMLALKVATPSYDDDLPFSNSFFNFWLLRTGQLTAGFSWAGYDDERYVREDIELMARMTTNFVQETCKDLLVVVDRGLAGRHWDIGFLHRTVADFLHEDLVGLAIKQRSPEHFEDPEFLIDLAKLRSVGLLSMNWKDCLNAEDIFASVTSSRLSRQDDYSWLSRCEALMIKFHQRMQKTGACRKDHHRTVRLYEFISAEVSEYLSALIVLEPCLAIGSNIQDLHNRRNVLEDFLFVRHNSLFGVFAESHTRILDQAVICGLRSTTSSWGFVTPLSGKYTYLRGCSTAYLQSPLACMCAERHTRLLRHLLSCGIDPNRRSHVNTWQPLGKDKCNRSIWQNWLRTAYLELEAEHLKHPVGFGSIWNHARHWISDSVALLLQYGADPTCSICVSRHHDGEACELESLENVLSAIIPQNGLSRLQALRTTCSTRFDRHVTRRNYMLRAMRSWTVSRTWYDSNSSYDQWDSCAFLAGFVQNVGSFSCDCCPDSECSEAVGFALAICLDCTGGYYMCHQSAHKHYPSIPTHDDVSRCLVHECLPADDPHVYIWFGQHRAYRPVPFYGVERSISVLEDWYARNTNGEDAALD